MKIALIPFIKYDIQLKGPAEDFIERMHRRTDKGFHFFRSRTAKELEGEIVDNEVWVRKKYRYNKRFRLIVEGRVLVKNNNLVFSFRVRYTWAAIMFLILLFTGCLAIFLSDQMQPGKARTGIYPLISILIYIFQIIFFNAEAREHKEFFEQLASEIPVANK